MTKRQHTAAGRYVRLLADELRLRDWTVSVSDEPSVEGTSATITPIYGRRRATIRLGEDFFEASRFEQRHTVTHELIHLHLEPASAMVVGDLFEVLGRRADKLFENVYRRHVEYAVDHLADAVAPLLPLPSWALTC